ncbi:MAG: hypothetical protein H7318_15205 [Oligoflexus sp.]|nr:hypothetical protein [Oligoflexus sp.]
MDIRREPVFENEPKKMAPTLAEFARKSQITEDKVWELIEEGQVSARFVNESILIMPDVQAFETPKASEVADKEPIFAAEVETLPELNVHPRAPGKVLPKIPSFLEKSFKVPAEPQPELDIEHIDFSQDSLGLLTFAQDALSRNAELSKELLATKNELIRLKDERIAFLSDLLNQRDKEIRSLNRNIEELATLNNFEAR